MDKDLEQIICFDEDGRKQCHIFPEAEQQIISFVFKYAKKKHVGQKRYTGEPYINHPVGVAKILVAYRAEYIPICAGLLHDVIEEQVDACFKKKRNMPRDELLALENSLFATLEEDMYTSFAEELVKQYCSQAKEVVNRCKEKLQELRTTYEEKFFFQFGVWVATKGEIIKNPSERIAAEDAWKKKEKQRMDLRIMRETQRFLREHYHLSSEAAEKTVTYTQDIAKIVMIVKLMTRSKCDYFDASLESIFRERNSEIRIWTIETKMADDFYNAEDMPKQEFTNIKRLSRGFKNIYLLNYVKNELCSSHVGQDDALYKLFRATCQVTALAVRKVAQSLEEELGEKASQYDWDLAEYEHKQGLDKVTKPNELQSFFDGRMTYYEYYMHGHKEKLEHALASAEDQYRDAIAFLRVLEKLAFDDTYVIAGIVLK